MGGRFPALEVFALPALSVLLALVVLWGLKPWEDDSDDPQPAPLGIEMAVGDAKAFPAGSTAAVAAGRVVPTGPKLVVQAGEPVERGTEAVPSLAVAPAQAVVVAEVPSSPQGPAPGAGAGDEVPSGGATDVEAPPEGTSSPVTTPVSTGGGTPDGPIASGGGPSPESCEGDEYVITVTFLDEESVGEESPVEILLQHFNEDGSVDELELEGDLADARRLALTLDSEGSCVEIVIAQHEEETEEEEAEEVPEASEEEVSKPAELAEPASP